MQNLNPFHKEKSLEDLEEEDEKVSHEYSIAQKKALIRAANKRGVNIKSFGGNFSALVKWFKTH